MPAQKQRGGSVAVVTKKKNKSGRKKCELGKACPYQHEYQHGLEFHHDEDGSKGKTKPNKPLFPVKGGRKLGGKVTRAAVSKTTETEMVICEICRKRFSANSMDMHRAHHMRQQVAKQLA